MIDLLKVCNVNYEGHFGPRPHSPSCIPAACCDPVGKWIYPLQTQEDGLWLHCKVRDGGCGWQGDTFQLVMKVLNMSDVAATLKLLKTKGVKISKEILNPNVIKSYEKHTKAIAAFAGYEKTMQDRRLGFMNGAVFEKYHITDSPHVKDMWWCSTPGELCLHLDGYTTDETAETRMLGGTTPEERESPVLVVPFLDLVGRLMGVAATRGDDWYWRGRINASAGAAFDSTHNDLVSTTPTTWNGHRLVTDSLDIAMKLQSRHRITATPKRILCLSCIPPHDKFTLRHQIEVLDNIYREPDTFLYASRIALPEILPMAKRLGMKLFPVNGRGPREYDLRSAADPVQKVGEILSDETCLENWAEVLKTEASYGFERLLSRLKWNDKLKREITEKTSEKFAKQVEGMFAPVRESQKKVKITEKLTVVETVEGWVDDLTGEILMEAIPVDVVAYRIAGKIRHRGKVRMGDKVFNFDTSRFRRDPVAVVEACLLRNGANYVPQPSPRVVPYVAALALYNSYSS